MQIPHLGQSTFSDSTHRKWVVDETFQPCFGNSILFIFSNNKLVWYSLARPCMVMLAVKVEMVLPLEKLVLRR